MLQIQDYKTYTLLLTNCSSLQFVALTFFKTFVLFCTLQFVVTLIFLLFCYLLCWFRILDFKHCIIMFVCSAILPVSLHFFINHLFCPNFLSYKVCNDFIYFMQATSKRITQKLLSKRGKMIYAACRNRRRVVIYQHNISQMTSQCGGSNRRAICLQSWLYVSLLDHNQATAQIV